MTEERRRYPRYAIEELDLHGTHDGERSFEVVTLSLGGMLVKLQEEPNLDRLMSVELKIGTETFRSEARVVFLGPDSSSRPGAVYRVGLAFEDPPPEELARLERFIGRELA